MLILAIGITILGLLATLLRNNSALPFLSNPLISVSLLIVGTSAVISILMPYAAESFPVRQRGRATGWVAGCSKVGGVIAQGLAALALVPAFGLAAGAIAIPTVGSLLLITIFGPETRGRDLRELEAEVSTLEKLEFVANKWQRNKWKTTLSAAATQCGGMRSWRGQLLKLYFGDVPVTFHSLGAKLRV